MPDIRVISKEGNNGRDLVISHDPMSIYKYSPTHAADTSSLPQLHTNYNTTCYDKMIIHILQISY